MPAVASFEKKGEWIAVIFCMSSYIVRIHNVLMYDMHTNCYFT